MHIEANMLEVCSLEATIESDEENSKVVVVVQIQAMTAVTVALDDVKKLHY